MKRMLYLDKKSNEIENILSNKKVHIIRAANIKKYPFKMIQNGYTVYFLNNDAEGIVLASANIKEAVFLELNDVKQRKELIEEYKDKILLSDKRTKYILDRKYISIFELSNIKKEYATIDHKLYGIVDDWIIVNDIK